MIADKEPRLDVILEGVDVGMDTQVQREEADEDDELAPPTCTRSPWWGAGPSRRRRCWRCLARSRRSTLGRRSRCQSRCLVKVGKTSEPQHEPSDPYDELPV